ncbi:sorting nexin-13 isoform X2 [Halyomorpha halys]|nr:sorting nexin-13-like isoform X2 [Halyomorpha halys]
MNVLLNSWSVLVLVLCFSTFGFTFCAVTILCIILFISGILTVMYIKQEKSFSNYFSKQEIGHPTFIYEVVEKIKKPKKDYKLDKRLTGSQVIDEELQDILDFIIRDYVHPWYDQLSDNDEFSYQLRLVAQNLIVAFSNRVKEIDWIPYLTTRLVDDAASHIRLYRQARARLKSSTGSKQNLEDHFFDLELAMEENVICRDHVSLQPKSQRCYLQQLSEVVLFNLSPEVEFRCLPLRFIARELIVNSVLVPLIAKLSDPDYINQFIIWLCKDIPVTSEMFLDVLRASDNIEELNATRDILNKEICTLRSRDKGGESEALVKLQLSSLIYLNKLVEARISRLQEGEDTNTTPDYSKLLLGSTKLFQLPLDVLLKNNLALSHFMDYMTSIGAHGYLCFYLNIEGWKASTEQQLSDMSQHSFDKTDVLLAEQYSAQRQTLDRVAEAAATIYQQYLSDQSSTRLQIDEGIVRRLHQKIRTEKPNENWFDEVQGAVYERIQNDEKFLNGFRASPLYVKLLAELDLVKAERSDEEDTGSLDEVSLNSDTASLPEFIIPHTNSADTENGGSPVHHGSEPKASGPFSLHAEIIETGLVHEKGKTFGMYAVSVVKKYENGHRDSWHVYRRYSDFHDLHTKIKEKYPELSKLTFPGKKTFHNMERKTLERRMIGLNNYLICITQPSLLASKPGLTALVSTFLQRGEYRPEAHISKTLDSLFRFSMQAVRTVPDSLMSSVDGVVDGLSRVLQVKTTREETGKVSASIDIESDDNIPTRILLLLMTEVFELKASSQWLRRRLVNLLRQIVRTMFGDIVNKRILDTVALLTSPHKVASYLRAFKDALWPHGLQGEPPIPRDNATKMRTRVAAKAALLSSLSDELKHILGSETSRYGIISVFSLLQCNSLNTRFAFVLLEGILSNLLGESVMTGILRRLHSKSPRIQDLQS